MSRTKDLYIEALEARWAELEEAGYDPDTAYAMAGDRAYEDLADRMADEADRRRDLWKDRDL